MLAIGIVRKPTTVWGSILQNTPAHITLGGLGIPTQSNAPPHPCSAPSCPSPAICPRTCTVYSRVICHGHIQPSRIPVLVGGAIPLGPAVPASTRISARLQRVGNTVQPWVGMACTSAFNCYPIPRRRQVERPRRPRVRSHRRHRRSPLKRTYCLAPPKAPLLFDTPRNHVHGIVALRQETPAHAPAATAFLRVGYHTMPYTLTYTPTTLHPRAHRSPLPE